MSRRAALAAALAVFAAGCDSFFEVRGRVNACSSGAPIVGVRAVLTLASGVSGSEVATAYSAPDGVFSVALNEPPTVSARLRLDKPGFVAVEREYEGAPSGEQAFCLDAAP